MALWDPLRDFSRMEQEIRRMFDDFWSDRKRWGILPGPRRAEVPTEREGTLVGTPRIDVVDKGGTLVLCSEMPGVKKDDIKITVTEDRVNIAGKVEKVKEEKEEAYYYCERGFSSWQRTIPLPVRVKADAAKAKYENGVLEVTLPKTEEGKAKEKVIQVE